MLDGMYCPDVGADTLRQAFIPPGAVLSPGDAHYISDHSYRKEPR